MTAVCPFDRDIRKCRSRCFHKASSWQWLSCRLKSPQLIIYNEIGIEIGSYFGWILPDSGAQTRVVAINVAFYMLDQTSDSDRRSGISK